ncbi:hypothetical protein, partial [Thiolapillus sp.]|uniref:hypothetical protein n=1 Tax=Thiolapillus sp. TaxID=2017437 RepID=UPI0025D321DE
CRIFFSSCFASPCPLVPQIVADLADPKNQVRFSGFPVVRGLINKKMVIFLLMTPANENFSTP